MAEFNMTGDTVVYPQLCSTPLRDNYRYSRDYLLIANFLVMAFIPLLLLIIFNSLTFKIIRASSLTNARTSTRQRRDQGIASMFIFIVIIFVIGVVIININTYIQSVFLTVPPNFQCRNEKKEFRPKSYVFKKYSM